MVRTTIACARCRLSKVKCVHEGLTPCRNCVKAGRTAPGLCVLSRPKLKKTLRSTGSPVQLTENAESRDVQLSRSGNTHTSWQRRTEQAFDTPVSVLLKAASTFMRKFPELGFLHKPTFSRDLKQSREARAASGTAEPTLTPTSSDVGSDATSGNPRVELLGTSLLALCARSIDVEGISAESHASITRASLHFDDVPHVYTVQTLLVMAMYEWGEGDAYRAWMYSGMAIRMMQFLNAVTSTVSLPSPQHEIHNRTYWACFVIDRLVSSGKCQPLALPLESMNTHWPVGDQDYAFGSPNHRHCAVSDYGTTHLGPHTTLDHSYSILLRGFEIWTKVHHWLITGGRRRVDMSLLHNYPWVETSLWTSLRRELQAWRDSQDPRLRYPETTVSMHTSLGKGEVFAYINLLYYVSLLFLTREYIPFLPSPESVPTGPIDPPLFTEEAPEGWWAAQTDDLFTSAACMTKLLADLDDEDASLYTPFAGFCNFSAATMNIYVACFPNMNLGRSRDPQATLETNLQYLSRFRDTWPLGKGWWTTIQHTKRLYERRSQDPRTYHGKTRDDFVDLEASIHDCSGRSPPYMEAAASGAQRHEVAKNGEVDHVEAPQQHHSQVVVAAQLFQDLSPPESWNQEWPLWGELHNIPFNYNLENFLQ